MEHQKCSNNPDRFVKYMHSSLQTETEQNSEAILEELRDESDHSESQGMALNGTCVLMMQHIERSYSWLLCILL